MGASYGVVSQSFAMSFERFSESAMPSTMGNTRRPYEPTREEVENMAKAAVRSLMGMPEERNIRLMSVLRDSSLEAPFPSEDLYRGLARAAGFDLSTCIRIDRRGFVHDLLMVRRGTDQKLPGPGEAEITAFDLDKVSFLVSASYASQVHLA